MSKSFDDLFDEFFEGPKKNTSSKKEDSSKPKESNNSKGLDSLPDDLPDPIKKIIEALNRGPRDISQDPMNFDKDNLGEPDSEEMEEDGDGFINKKTWDTDFGSVTRITIGGSIPEGEDPEEFIRRMREKMGIPEEMIGMKSEPKRELTLEEKLEIELAKDTEEGYKEAAKIRDMIKLRESDEKNSEKVENAETRSEKGKDDFDDFPF